MPFCVKCGTEVPENLKFCGNCGSSLRGEQSSLELWNPQITKLCGALIFFPGSFISFFTGKIISEVIVALYALFFVGIILYAINCKTLWEQSSGEEKISQKNRMIAAGILFLVSFLLLFMPIDIEKFSDTEGLLLWVLILLGVAVYICPAVLQEKYIMRKYGDESKKSLKHLKIKLNTNQRGKK
jgi:phosphoglycerol transferase MdoB-like AlkP superfamily enzyme